MSTRHAVTRRHHRVLTLLVVTALAAGTLAPANAQPGATTGKAPGVQTTKSVPVQQVPRSAVKMPRNDVHAALKSENDRRQSSPGPTDVQPAERDLSESWSDPVGALAVRGDAGATTPTTVRVSPLASKNSDTTSTSDMTFALTPQDGQRNAVKELRLDYSSLGGARGAGWTDRLRWKLLTGCDIVRGTVTTCADATTLKTEQQQDSNTMTAVVPSSANSRSAMVVAASSSAAGTKGDYSASPLKSSSSWVAGLQSGAFEWAYDLATPAAVNGPEPDLSISYSSDAVDGLTSATNNQASWIGDGFDLSQGFVERTYEACQFVEGTSNAPSTSQDLCWRNDNLVMSFGGSSGELVQDTSNPDVWRLKSDDGSRIERVKNSGRNRDNDGEYWMLTTTDGTRYYFGLNKRVTTDVVTTDSVSTVPVYGSRSGEPCHASSFAGSVCDQAWRWNLDYVVDPNGNSMTIFYDQEKNKYGSNGDATVRSYDRASVMRSIEYGTRKGTETAGPAPFRVLFSSAERCLPASGVTSCGTGTIDDASAKHWPDVPVDQICDSTSSCGDSKVAPTFFSRKRLVGVRTEVAKSDGSYAPVNSWELKQSLPATGDSTDDPDDDVGAVKTLWLESIQQTGRAGGTQALPAVKFSGESMANRVDGTNDHLGAFRRFRLNGITNGVGGSVIVRYDTPTCTASTKPTNLDDNLSDCFPVYYEPIWNPGKDNRQLEFFHKYRVKSVSEADRTMSSPAILTSYEYDNLVSDGTAAATKQTGWHYANATTERRKYRTWNDWRGYARVTTEVGVADGTKTFSRSSFLRGMDGDRKSGGGTRSVLVNGVRDADQAAGFEVRSETTLGRGGALVSQTDTAPWLSSVTADGGTEQARMVREGSVTTTTPISGAAARVTKTSTTYNSYGLPTMVNDVGDIASTPGAADDRCTTTEYVTADRDTWMLDYPTVEKTIGRTCGTAPTTDDDVVAATRSTYDSRGNVVKEESAKSLSNGTLAYQVDSTTTVDSYGRTKQTTDAAGKSTTLAYSPETGPADSVTTTNALGQTSETTLDRVLGQPAKEKSVGGEETSFSYDPLGRKTAVWGPGRVKGTDSASAEMSYDVSDSAPNKVTTKQLNARGEYSVTATYLDGLMRERSTQTMAAGSDTGRLITETQYDERGFTEINRGPYYNTAAVGSGVVYAQQNAIPSSHYLLYDRAGRQVSDEFSSRGTYKWKTTTSYGGDRVTVTPPQGGTKTTTVTDARGQKTTLLQYKSATSTDADKTTYGYNARGQLTSTTNAAGTVWRKAYDIRGRQTRDVDPDRGTATATFDELDRQVTATDARGTTLWTRYDALGRKTGLYNDSAATSKRAEWEYDGLRKGHETRSTRYVGSLKFTNETLTIDAAGRVTSSRLLMPSRSELGIPASSADGYQIPAEGFKSRTIYNVDGSVNTMVQPFVPGITNELVDFGYDRVGNVQTMAGDGSIISGTVMSPFGDVLQRQMGPSFGEAVFDTREYDEATRRLTRHWTSLQGTGTTAKQDLRYTYDPTGNVTQLNDVAPGDTNQSAAATWRQCFSYDYLQRLTQAWSAPTNSCATKPSGSAPNLGTTNPYWDEFTYDASGNRTKRIQHTKSGTADRLTTWTSSYPAASAARPHAVSSVAKSGAVTETESFEYDAAGNTSSRVVSSSKGQTITWDAEGHQASVKSRATGGADVRYVYDADGQRLVKFSGATTTLYVGTAEIELTGSSARSVRTYTVGDEPVAMRDGRGLSVLVGDHHSTSSLVVTGDGSARSVVKRRFDPFGNVASEASAGAGPVWPSRRGFLNKSVDVEVGTTHVGAREYDSSLGRFVSPDPITDVADPQQLNGYAYANNSPVTSSDPTGLWMNMCAMFPFCSRSNGGGQSKGTGGRSGSSRSKAAPAPSPTPGFVPYRITRSGRFECAGGANCVAPAPGPGPTLKQYAVAQLLFFSRLVVFDDSACHGQSASGKGCAGEIAMIIPFGKIGRAAKFRHGAKGIDAMADGAKRSAGYPTMLDRSPLDVKVNPNAPAAKRWRGRPVSKSATQNQMVWDMAEDLAARGATDIRINQQQVNYSGRRVGINRPDLQYSLGGKRHYREFESPGSDRLEGHRARIASNDPEGDFFGYENVS